MLQTIIECLKQACTGDFPPNIKSGQGFIHDPKASLMLLPQSPLLGPSFALHLACLVPLSFITTGRQTCQPLAMQAGLSKQHGPWTSQ